MKKIFNTLFFGTYSAMVFAAVAAVSILLNYSSRFSYVFIDGSLFDGCLFTLFILAVISAGVLVFAASCSMKGSKCCESKIFKAVACIAEIYAIIFAVIALVTFILSDSESRSVIMRLMKQAVGFWAAAVSVSFAAFIMPNFKKAGTKKVLSIVTAVILAVVVYSSLFPISPYKFTSGTAVFDNGKDYSVVFSTNDKGTAYIEYEYEGETVRIYDENNGRKNGGSIIHTVHVPYNQLVGNTYKVFSTRVIDELSYGGRLGKTIESESIKFNDALGSDVTVLTVSDWHTHTETAKQAIAHLGEYNAVILLGDSAPGLSSVEEMQEYIVKFAGDVSGGKMPVLFARGNHETRGKQANQLATYLGMDKFYFTANLGDYSFVVLDSGEDKKDDHIEYGGMVAYEQHRKNMVNWLCNLENTQNKKTVALSHSDEICIEEDLSKTALDKLDKLNVSLLVSGHLHEVNFKPNEPYPTLIDGGINALGKHTYVASKLTLTDEKIEILSVDTNGKTAVDETVEWR